MENSKIKLCKEIFEVIKQDRMRYWAKHIEAFIDSLLMLSKEEFLELKSAIALHEKFHLMSQVVHNHGNYFLSAPDSKKQKMLTQVYMIVFLENFEFDYRETLLEIRSFTDKTMGFSKEKDIVWSNVVKFKFDRYDIYKKEAF